MRKRPVHQRPDLSQDEERARAARQENGKAELGPQIPLVEDMLALQGDLGNQVVAGMLAHDSEPPDLAPDEQSHPAQDHFGEGQVLAPHLRATMERAYGQDFGAVRVHTGGAAAQFVDRHGADAITVGQDIAFGSGKHQPGTAIGDAIMAHELAHVVQQQPAGPAGQTEFAALDATTEASLEQDANRSALGALGLFGRLGSGLRNLVGDATPRLRTGLTLQATSCSAEEEEQTPEFFGPESIQCAEDLKTIAENWGLVGDLIVGGTLLSLATSSPAETLASGSHDVSPQAQALAGIPVIVREEMRARIQLLLTMDGNSLNQQEQRFWEERLEMLTQAGQQAESESE